MRNVSLVSLMAFCVALVPSDVSAQDFRASVVGRVTDSTSAPIVGARVTATNLGTSTPSNTVTNEEGNYVIASLPPGRYRIEVEQRNFKRYIREGVTLEIGDNPTLDVTLEPGGVTEEVIVTADVSPLETGDATRGTVISGRLIEDAPLNGRNAFALAGLAPGVVFTSRGQGQTFLRTSANLGISSISINGAPPRSNEALLDGVPNTGSDGLIQFVPSTDATQEFKVQTSSFDAEFGRWSSTCIIVPSSSSSPSANATSPRRAD